MSLSSSPCDAGTGSPKEIYFKQYFFKLNCRQILGIYFKGSIHPNVIIQFFWKRLFWETLSALGLHTCQVIIRGSQSPW